MKAFFTVIFIALAIIFLCTTIFAGFKALFFGFIQKLKNMLSGNSFEKIKQQGSNIFADRRPESFMKVINLTTGKCDRCGRIYVGTTEDKDCPLHDVKFMGEQKVLCDDCLKQIMSEFNQSSPPGETRYSQTAENLKNIFSNIGNSKK